MTLPSPPSDASTASKPTGLWQRWQPNKLVPRLAPRLNRRRRSSMAFPLAADAAATAVQDDADSSSPEQQQQQPPRTASPPPASADSTVVVQEEFTTPRTEQRETLDTSFSLTPPAASPAPLMVSAKRLGSEVRRNHSKRRKGRLGHDKENVAFNMSVWRAENELEEEDDPQLPAMDHLSPEERTQRYWQWCYGSTEAPLPQSSWSASRAPPRKSCLSSVKKMIRAVTLETPTFDRHSAKVPSTVEFQSATYASPCTTPFPPSVAQSKSVQFGMPSAAEYELDCPPVELTPLPAEVAKERFPVTEPEEDSPEKEATEETKHNTAMLAMWEDDFDSYLSNDSDEESSSEELESMLFSRKNRRSSRLFSPNATALLLPDNDDDVVEVNMASLAVESPSRSLDGTPSSTLCLPSPASTIDTSPPSDVRLETVNSAGGALVEENPGEGGSNMNPSRQLHSDLERCVEDSVTDVMATIMMGVDGDWPAACVLQNMARLQRGTTHAPYEQDMLSFLESPLLSSLQRMVRTDLLQSIKTLQGPCPSPTISSLPKIRSSLPAFLNLEWQHLELNMLQSLLERLREAEANARNELAHLKVLQPRYLKHREAVELAELQCLVRSERAQRDLAVARARHQQALCELERAAPFNVLRCLALSSMVSFSIESLSPARVEISFIPMVEGPHPCLRWDVVDGIVCYIKPHAATVREGKRLIPVDHVAASFYQSMLSTKARGGLEIRPFLQQCVMSNDLAESVLGLSLVLGRLDLAILDLTRVMAKPYVHNVTVARKYDSLVQLSISLQDLQVNFFYYRDCEESILYSIPAKVTVMQGGVRMESLEAVAVQTMHSESTSASCLERICDAFVLALCI